MFRKLIQASLNRPKSPRRRRCPPKRSTALRLEMLESRTMLTVFTVANATDAVDGDLDDLSLREAIQQANTNPNSGGPDVVKFDLPVPAMIELDPGQGQLEITEDLIIQGPGAEDMAVSGAGQTRVFAVLPNPATAASPSVTIKKLSIVDGLASDAPGIPEGGANPGFAFGGGLYNLGGAVHLERVYMANNVAENVVTAGGAVANEFGGTLTVSRSRFENNRSLGGLIAVGGAVTSDLGPTASGGTTDPPEVTVDRSSFVGNTAQAQAGYIDLLDETGAPMFPFSGLGGGGAILNVTGSLTITRSHFEDNSAKGGVGVAGLPDVPDSTSGGPGFGGAVMTGNVSPFGAAQSTLKISRSEFVNNVAAGGASIVADVPGGEGAGGAVSVVSGSNAILTRNDFHQNKAEGGEGGANSAGGNASGGGVSGSGGATLALSRNRFVENAVAGGEMGGVARGGGLGLAAVDLAGFFPGPASGSISRDTFLANQAGGSGLGGGLGGGVFNDGALTVQKAEFTENQAKGDPAAIVVLSPVASLVGGATGGGIANFGTLEVNGSQFTRNISAGADDADSSATVFPGPAFPGGSFGGGIANYDRADVRRSYFAGNEAKAGDRGIGDFATLGSGGGIYNDAVLRVSHSRFSHNQVLGGDAGVSPFHNGHALGGAISSGSLLTGADLTVRHSSFVGNHAKGGSDNIVVGNHDVPVEAIPEADAPNNGYGGAILVYEGAADIRHSQLRNNRAEGGDGDTDNGNLGVGGAIFLFNFVGTGVHAELDHLSVQGNRAVGGAGGDGIGGGVAIGSLNSLFIADIGASAISSSVISGNRAIGGPGGGNGLGGGVANVIGGETLISRSLITGNKAIGGSGGGSGFGGGVYNEEDASLELVRDIIFLNWAVGGGDGTGRGGGIYNEGTLDIDPFTIWLTRFNHADEDDFDNFFGV